MQELRRKQKFKRALYSFPSLILLILLTYFLAKGTYGVMSIERESSQTVKKLEGEVALLSLRERELKDEINLLRTEEGIVEEIRRKFSVTNEGEHVAVIVEAREKEGNEGRKKSWWRKVLDAIMPPYGNQ
jgi:cell division protein FtsB